MNFFLSTPAKDLEASATRRVAAFLRSFERPAGYRLCIGILFLTSLLANAQPLPPDTTGLPARYLFTVYTPLSAAETLVWHNETVSLTTHRLIDKADSTEVRFPAASTALLRTYVDLGANAGAVQVNEAMDAPTILEHLSYPDLLSPAQRQLTESYLAIRHGLTLHQYQPTNYLAPAAEGGTYPVWTATAERDFRHRITGLALDDQSHLKRLQGSSVLAPDLLQLQWEEAPHQTAYLLLADDDLPTAREPNVSPDGTQRLQRRWRVQATGEAKPTSLVFSPQQLFARAQPGELWQLILRQADGSEAIFHPSSASRKALVFSGIHFPADTVSYLQLALACDNCQRQATTVATDFVSSVELSPNPVSRNEPVQLRVALREAAALVVTAYDASGKLVFQHPTLPTASHHLTELTFPAPGPYTLHLRPRLKSRKAPQHTLRVIVH